MNRWTCNGLPRRSPRRHSKDPADRRAGAWTALVRAALFLIALVLIPSRAGAAPGDTLSQATQKGVDFVVPETVQWTSDMGCIACHRQGAPLYAASLAKGAGGFNVNMSTTNGLPKLAEYLVNDQDPSIGAWLWGGPNALKTSYVAFGLAGYDAYVSTLYSNNLVKAADFMLSQQQSDGRWIMDFEDGVTAHGDMTVTARYMVAITQAKLRVDATKAAAYQASITKAVNYINAHKSDMNDVTGVGFVYELSWAIIGLKAAGVPNNDATLQALLTDLQARKSNLGFAWGQVSNDNPDLFNSGMAIYALCKGGVPAIGNTSLKNSLGWVNNQQGSDGSWGDDIKTTFGILGLSCYGDYGVNLTNSGVVTKVISSNSPNPQTATYTFTLENHGFLIDTYNLTVVGGMPGWSGSIISPVTLAPGAQQTVTLTVNAPPNLPEALPVEMTVVATSQTVATLNASARVTTFTDPPPPVSGDSTAVTLTAGAGSSVPLGGTLALKATVKDTTSNTGVKGPGKGVVTFFVAGFAIATDTDADGDGVYGVTFKPDCAWTPVGQQDFRAIYSGIDLPSGQTDLLPSLAASTLTLTVPACCAKPEVCDGKDNDCDGAVDNGFNVNAACSVGVGECVAAGTLQCSNNAAACTATARAPQAEVCDGKDNNCDGVVDDGNPGGNASCTTQLLGVCSAGATLCSAGGVVCAPAVLPGTQADVCNGSDDDCDGVVDNGFKVGQACTLGLGVCAAQGVFSCQANGTSACNAVAGLPQVEICADDLDSDCDGNKDNGCACLSDAACGGPNSGQVCDRTSFTCVLGCHAGTGNGCSSGLRCTAQGSETGACVACLTDTDCGAAGSGTLCDTSTHTCHLGCTGGAQTGCPGGLVCTSQNNQVGSCVACVADSDCGGAHSGLVCNAGHACVLGCRGDGNGCSAGLTCTSQDAALGKCVGCLTDANCGGPKSGSVCDTDKQTCTVGCKGTDGNGCSGNLVCTSMNGATGNCAGCVHDSDCGPANGGAVCEATSHTCQAGCRAAEGSGCAGNLVCTSTTQEIGSCVGCLTDANCGDAKSGIVCDVSTRQCKVGCRGAEGNACSGNLVCTSVDDKIGKCAACTKDADCGDAKSGLFCDTTTLSCQVGCHSGGNGCSGKLVCSTTDGTAGKCTGCGNDTDCGAKDSGIVCNLATTTCVTGCRGSDGNGCAAGFECSSTDASVGTCVVPAPVAVPSADAGAGGENGDAGAPAASVAGAVAQAGMAGSAAASAGSGGLTTATPELRGDGCSCTVAGRSAPPSPTRWLAGLALVGMMLARRRRHGRNANA